MKLSILLLLVFFVSIHAATVDESKVERIVLSLVHMDGPSKMDRLQSFAEESNLSVDDIAAVLVSFIEKGSDLSTERFQFSLELLGQLEYAPAKGRIIELLSDLKALKESKVSSIRRIAMRSLVQVSPAIDEQVASVLAEETDDLVIRAFLEEALKGMANNQVSLEDKRISYLISLFPKLGDENIVYLNNALSGLGLDYRYSIGSGEPPVRDHAATVDESKVERIVLSLVHMDGPSKMDRLQSFAEESNLSVDDIAAVLVSFIEKGSDLSTERFQFSLELLGQLEYAPAKGRIIELLSDLKALKESKVSSIRRIAMRSLVQVSPAIDEQVASVLAEETDDLVIRAFLEEALKGMANNQVSLEDKRISCLISLFPKLGTENIIYLDKALSGINQEFKSHSGRRDWLNRGYEEAHYKAAKEYFSLELSSFPVSEGDKPKEKPEE